jgi:hypothetical protein
MSMQPGAMATGARQRLMLVVLAGALVLALALALRPLVLNRERPTAAPTATTVASAAAATTTSTVVLGESDQPLRSTKDPFRPLVTPGVAGGTGATAAASANTGPTLQGTVPGAGAGTATAPGGAAVAEQKVTLLDIATKSGARMATVEVDGTRYTVGEGESFAGTYRAVDVGSSCATFESGTTPFTLCEGEAVLK